MAKALGIGGIFFRSTDRAALADWYAQHLGFEIDPSFGGTAFQPAAMPASGYTIWSPFAADSDYFGAGDQRYMINLVVDDVREALAQVAAGGAETSAELEESEFGTFGWFVDPDGNRVELWQPPEA